MVLERTSSPAQPRSRDTLRQGEADASLPSETNLTDYPPCAAATPLVRLRSTNGHQARQQPFSSSLEHQILSPPPPPPPLSTSTPQSCVPQPSLQPSLAPLPCSLPWHPFPRAGLPPSRFATPVRSALLSCLHYICVSFCDLFSCFDGTRILKTGSAIDGAFDGAAGPRRQALGGSAGSVARPAGGAHRDRAASTAFSTAQSQAFQCSCGRSPPRPSQGKLATTRRRLVAPGAIRTDQRGLLVAAISSRSHRQPPAITPPPTACCCRTAACPLAEPERARCGPCGTAPLPPPQTSRRLQPWTLWISRQPTG